MKKTPVKAKPKKRGQPSKFKTLDLELLRKLYLAGHTDYEVADFMKVSKRSIDRYKVDNPDFCHSIKDWKIKADDRVERSLYERAMGFTHKSEEIFCAFGKVTKVPIVKIYPPDPLSCIFWLKNRKPEQYRDKPEEPENKDLLESQLIFHGIPGKGKLPARMQGFIQN